MPPLPFRFSCRTQRKVHCLRDTSWWTIWTALPTILVHALRWKNCVAMETACWCDLTLGGDAVWTKLCYACRCFFVRSSFIYGETDHNGCWWPTSCERPTPNWLPKFRGWFRAGIEYFAFQTNPVYNQKFYFSLLEKYLTLPNAIVIMYNPNFIF